MAGWREIFVMGVVVAGVGVARGVWGEDVAGTRETIAGVAATVRAEEGRVQYWFGVAVENLPPTIAKQLKLKSDQGLMVVAVLANTPAEKAGLKAEDLLIELDGNPLTSQEDLARAANTPRSYRINNDTQVQTLMVKRSSITFLREGDKKTVSITPAVRPDNLVVVGNSVNTFTMQNGRLNRGANGGANGAGQQVGASAGGNGTGGDGKMDEVRNIVLPDGTAVQVGPGYTFEVNGDSTTQTVQSIRKIVGRGQTVVLSQENDGKGNYKNTIVVGGNSYAVEHGKLDAIPAEARPLAQQMLVNMPEGGGTTLPAVQLVPAPVGGLEQRVNELEKQNQSLQTQLKELIDLLKENKKGG